MGEEKEILLTPEGFERLERELDELKTVRRREVAARIKQALEFGDISENSEYDDAKNEQAFVEGRIAALESMLRKAKVVQPATDGAHTAIVGSTVRIRDLESGEEMAFTLVGPAEADPGQNRISYASPVGRALMGKGPGSVVEVEAPAGLLRYQVLSVEN